MYSFEIKENVTKELEKLSRKNKQLFEEVKKKIIQIAENPFLGKPLRNVLKGKRRVHVSHFVLIYEILMNEHKLVLLKFSHHDDAY